MSFQGLTWATTGDYDIHLLPGMVSPQIKHLLRGLEPNPAGEGFIVEPLSKYPTLDLKFAAQFAGAPNKHGIELNPTTGEITVAATLPAGPKLRSFIVTATGKLGAIQSKMRTRVNIHGAISKMWLTPAQLTVRKVAKGIRFSVLAQFDDDVIGDITNWSPFENLAKDSDINFAHLPGSDTPVLTWSSENTPPGGDKRVLFDPKTGVLNAQAESGKAKVTVKFQAKTASADVVCGKFWFTNEKLTLVSGPGVREMNFVPNILFLPDGFQDRDKTAYERIVRFVVTRLSVRNRTRPFGAFTGRINYFMGWLPSPDAGISVLNELDRVNISGSTAEGSDLEMPSPNRAPTGKWTLKQLINEVGLPTPRFEPIISALDQSRIDAWQALYGTQVTKARMQDVFPDWIKRNDRVLLNERDTAFHMAFGDRPALDGTTTDHGLLLNPRRIEQSDFHAFLDGLTGPRGQALADVWSTGKDKGRIVFLCRSNYSGGLRSGNGIGVSLGRRLLHKLVANPLGNGFDLEPDPIPTDPSYEVWLTVAHELGHAFGLGDEYGGQDTPPGPSDIAEAVAAPNLQDRASVVAASGNIETIDKIKWRDWPRIAKAGVLVLEPKPAAGGKFTLTLNDAKATGLKPRDIVRLRTRPLALAAEPSRRFKVESVTDHDVAIVPLSAGPFDPKKFPAGSIVMVPVRGRDPNPATDHYADDLALADQDVLIRIAITGNPLNAQPAVGEAPPPHDPQNRPCANVDLKTPTAAKNFLDRKAPKPPLFSSWTIGLYENGARHNCGVFRPTGVCIMNTQSNKDRRTGDINMYDFCLICRYAIVDAVDPTRHGDVEVDFRERYGSRGAP